MESAFFPRPPPPSTPSIAEASAKYVSAFPPHASSEDPHDGSTHRDARHLLCQKNAVAELRRGTTQCACRRCREVRRRASIAERVGRGHVECKYSRPIGIGRNLRRSQESRALDIAGSVRAMIGEELDRERLI